MISSTNVKILFEGLPKGANQIEIDLLKSLLFQQVGLLQLATIERQLNLEKDSYEHSNFNQELSKYAGEFILHDGIFDYLRSRINNVESDLQIEYKNLIDLYEESFDGLLNIVDRVSENEDVLIERIKAILL